MRQGVRLGVDVGSVRIGISRSDPDGLLATPCETVPGGKREIRDALDRIAAIAADVAAVEVIVGLPRSLSGEEGPAAGRVRAYAGRIARRLDPVPVRLFDERLSTVTAHQRLREAGMPGRKRRPVIDQEAAVVILQAALDLERSTGNRPGALVEVSPASPPSPAGPSGSGDPAGPAGR